MDNEAEIVTVERKVDGKLAPVLMDKAKFDAAPPGTYKLWDEKKAPAAKKDDEDDKPLPGGFKIKKEGKGAAAKWLIFDKEDKQVGTEKYDSEENAKIMVDLLAGEKPATPPAQ